MSRFDITSAELALQLKNSGIRVQKSYMHEDYRTMTFSIPYDMYDDLEEMVKYIGCSRSNLIQTLIARAYERFEDTSNPFGEE